MSGAVIFFIESSYGQLFLFIFISFERAKSCGSVLVTAVNVIESTKPSKPFALQRKEDNDSSNGKNNWRPETRTFIFIPIQPLQTARMI